MNCPYYLSEVSEEAYVCKTCSRDLYLFKPMMANVADLEGQLAAVPSPELYELRIAELEQLLDEQNQKLEKSLHCSGSQTSLYTSSFHCSCYSQRIG